MANPGVGAKFVSVNLNKSYGQPSHHHHHPPHHSAYGTNRGRPGSHGSGGMVVLSRPRSANKAAGSKLSVPPPLNLPSLRKEHERFDSLGSGGGPAGGGAAGSGARPTSSGVGWTKPTAVALQEKEGGGDHGGADDANDQTLHGVDGVSRGNSVGSSVYMPPSARPGSVGSLPTPAYQSAEKALLLRGEDFPSLQAALPSSSGPSQKSKDGLNQKQRQAVRDELLNEQSDSSHSSFLVDMRPQLQTSRHGGQNENGSESKGLGGDRASEQVRKQDEYFPGPLPLVRLNPRSDWADDERDTSQGFTDRGRDHGYSKTEAYWDRDFDMPRISVLPHKPVHNPTERWGPRDSEAGKVSSSEVPKVDPYGRDVRTPSREGREGNSWRNTTFLKDGNSGQVGNDRSGFGARPSSLNRETSKDNKYSLTSVQEDNFVRRDGYRQGGRQPWNNSTDSYTSRGPEWNKCDRYGSEQQNRYRGDALQSSSASKLSYSVGGKGLPVNDPLLNFGRDKRPFSKSEKPYVDDPFMKDFGGTGFDSREPFSAGLFGVVKKKKDVIKQTDFHDPVRESFEAELERVQKMQEQERQQIIEEQERAVELARREEEERTRMAREQEERQRRMEEEARESAWRAEQEQLDAMRRAEEQRLAREEEKRRLFLEEERRKHAAKQKLLELEERIAKRKAETGKTGGNSLADADEKMSRMEKEKDASRAADMGDWEDGERMVERITASASSDSSLNRSFEMGSRSHYSRDSSPFVDRGKPVNSWRRDVYENGSSSSLLLQHLDNGHHSPRRDSSVGGRAPLREEFYGGSGFMSSSTYDKGGISEPLIDDITHLRGQRWNLSGDGDHYSRNMEIESEFHDKLVEKFSDAGWGQGRVHGNPYSPYPEQSYPNSDADGPYSFNRSRYSMRQPRVLPPPSLASMHKTSYRGDINRPGPSAFLDNETQYDHAARSEPTVQTGYDTNRPENIGQPEIINVKQENMGSEKQKLDSNTTPRCDSQSSLSVSSPPSSPTHLSHDDLDESRDSSVLSAPGDGKEVPLSGQENEPLVLPTNPGQENVMNASSSISTGDDEEWAVENNGHLQEQEEYDEDEDGYGEEDEVHEVDDENIDLTQEFDDVHLEEKGSPDMDNLVLGFNEGVEVGMPNDEFERSSRNEEGTFVVPKVASGTVEGLGPFDGICTDEPTLQPMDGSSQVNVGSSSRMFQETEKAMQNLEKMLRALTLRRSVESLHHHNHLRAITPTTVPQNPLTQVSSTRALSTLSSPSSPAPSSSASELRKYLGYAALVLFSAAATYYSFPFPENAKHKKAQIFRYAPLPEDLHTVSNWSGTHEVQTRVFHQPETLEELEKVVKDAHEKKSRIRPVGSGLSPNGIGLSRAGMVNLALMDQVLEVDKEKKRVRVQAGIRVQQLVDGIKEHGITLQNFASIREQQIGGILQVGAHGTGARLPPMDEQVISMKLVTPAKGTIEVSKEKDPELFYLARCGLGGLGVVAEVTIQCVDRQELVEHTTVSTMAEIKKNHKKLLSENRHVKYLYIPYTDTVVVVKCNPVSKWKGPPKFTPKYSSDEAIQHVRDLYRECLQKYRVVPDKSEVDMNELSFTELRDKLLALDPLDKDHVAKVNQAEAEFWKKSEGYRVGWSDEILGFDCGGQQWVSETCFPAGTLAKPSMKDLEYIEGVKQLIEKNEIPAPAPIEQRWTACTKSPMSPASSTREDDIFSWVGIIMYLPTTDPRQRKEITEEFFHYRRLTQTQLWDKYSAYEHWAKIEVPKDKDELAALQDRLRKRFPVDAYNKARRELDPNRILSNSKLEKLFPLSDTI